MGLRRGNLWSVSMGPSILNGQFRLRARWSKVQAPATRGDLGQWDEPAFSIDFILELVRANRYCCATDISLATAAYDDF